MNEIARSIFSGMQILIEGEWLTEQALVVEENHIKAIIPFGMIQHHLPAKHYEFPNTCYLIPGLIDLHVHGLNGHDVMDGTKEAQLAISHALAAEGVTGYLATTMTAEDAKIEAALKAVAAAKVDAPGATILGIHLEGPFIGKGKMGAQREEAIQAPNVAKFQHWQHISDQNIKLVTLAPELNGIEEFITFLHKANVIASIGHTAATYEETNAAIAAGCTHATHLFNAMSGLHQRAPGVVGAILLAKTVTAELIVDGLHLHPGVVSLALECKGKEKLVLITDAMRAKCLSDGRYDLGGSQVIVQQGKATLSDGTLAGSTLRLPQAIRNMVNFTQCSLADAVYMASTTPSQVLGLKNQMGTLEIGKLANLVVLDAQLSVKLTMCQGKEIYSL